MKILQSTIIMFEIVTSKKDCLSIQIDHPNRSNFTKNINFDEIGHA